MAANYRDTAKSFLKPVFTIERLQTIFYVCAPVQTLLPLPNSDLSALLTSF